MSDSPIHAPAGDSLVRVSCSSSDCTDARIPPSFTQVTRADSQVDGELKIRIHLLDILVYPSSQTDIARVVGSGFKHCSGFALSQPIALQIVFLPHQKVQVLVPIQNV